MQILGQYRIDISNPGQQKRLGGPSKAHGQHSALLWTDGQNDSSKFRVRVGH